MAFKHNKTKLFCASFLPEFLTGPVSNAITWILTAVFGAIAGIWRVRLLLSPHGYRGDCYRRWCHARIVLVLIAFVTVFLTVFGKMLKHRAVGYWAARYASEWADEDKDDVFDFCAPG